MTQHLLCYDIRDPVRLRRVHQLCRRLALPVQHSVYLLTDDKQLDRLLRLVLTVTKPEDDVRCYTTKDQNHWLVLGCDVVPGPNLTLSF